MKKFSLIIVSVFFISGLTIGQSGTSVKKRKVVTIEKKIDKNGNEVIEKKILEDDAVKKDVDWNDKEGTTIHIDADSSGKKTKIIINETIENDNHGDTPVFSGSNRGYRERTVIVKKNDDGSVEIREKNGDDISKEFNLKIDSSEAKRPNIGVVLNDEMRVTNVIKDGAAEAAGIEKGDVLTNLDGVFIEDYDHLKDLLSKKRVGDKVTLSYLRERKEMKTSLTLKGGTTRVYFNR